MDYFLDTNACIALIKGEPAGVRARLKDVVGGGAQIWVSSVVAFELWYGASKTQNFERNAMRLRDFFGGGWRVADFDEEDARRAGEVRAQLEREGKPIGAYDVLIAGQALRRGHTLVTANTKEFTRVKGLRWEDWAEARN
jgi:tRNA(fMet)-specific endonuclease VapC